MSLINHSEVASEEEYLNCPIPKRSLFYSLKPIRSETGEIECLSSYLIRLAEAHTTTPWHLLKDIIAPRLFRPATNVRNRLAGLIKNSGTNFNGTSSTREALI